MDPERVVWTGGGVALNQCPVSVIEPESLSLLEEYAAMKALGVRSEYRGLPARTVDGFLVIEKELGKERSHDYEAMGGNG